MQDGDSGGKGRQVDVLVCRKCLGKCARSGGQDLPRWLQGELAERGLAGQVRITPTGCMNQCPRRQVTVLVSDSEDAEGRMLLVEPRLQRDLLLKFVERRARPDAPATTLGDDSAGRGQEHLGDEPVHEERGQ
ncbi:(2Fe-2S) ferredoxin domain-containing protein [Corallococcus sp. AB049A]|uniref:(2Fe-2S) ferredoxin domain-containing protein n=1 Tax=Corallococcus interemptor TaxID=2316720 RepID=A0A3A8QBC8_9BACT|nr:(2Fe-2S) ferredoxin domain-containing protein [Corallococcus sp. AB050B]RKH65983.1 (2Fe-2S) ferredoxin domain-containing protein [Corallococcus interemptor]RKI56211.1 (2Fe-2S) ferredoxin domain-containing protein [Corallococcus sp. AB049A]